MDYKASDSDKGGHQTIGSDDCGWFGVVVVVVIIMLIIVIIGVEEKRRKRYRKQKYSPAFWTVLCI